jgi:hypothetical protein
MGILGMLLPALVPVAADGLKGLFRKFTGGDPAEPQNVEEQIELIRTDTERLRAMAELDRPHGEISRWVADLRASFRYVLSALIIVAATGIGVYVAAEMPELRKGVFLAFLDLAGGAFSFVFGDRMYRHLKGALR